MNLREEGLMATEEGGLSRATLDRLKSVGYDCLKGPVKFSVVRDQMKPEDDVIVVNSEYDPPAAEQEFPLSRLCTWRNIPKAGMQFMAVIGPTGRRHFQARRDREMWRDVRISNEEELIHLNHSALKFSAGGRGFTEITNIRDIYIFRSSRVDAAAEAAVGE